MTREECFEDSWNNFSKSTRVIEMRIGNSNYSKPFEEDDANETSFGFEVKQNTRLFEEPSFSRLKDESKFKETSHDATFMEVNDSFCQQFKGFIQ